MSFSNNNFKIDRINNSNNCEKSFWKIFSNFYLLKLIFNKINNTEWAKFENPKKINYFKNRKKFKDITSLKWMLKKKLFSLLKLKINNNEEFINIDKYSIYELFRSLSLTPNSINVLDNTIHGNNDDEDNFIETQEKWIYDDLEAQYDQPKSIVQYNENDIIQIKEILHLLLNKRRNEFEICDLTNAAINCNSLYVLKLLSSGPYYIDVIPSSILLAYRKCDPIIILELFKFNKSIFSFYEIKIHSLEQSSKNKNNSLEMVKFILENDDLYKLNEIEKQSPSSYISLFFIETSHRKLKVENVLKLKCLKTIKILMELNLIEPSTFIDNSIFDILNFNNTFEELKTILLFCLKYFPKLKNDKEINKKLENILENDYDNLKELQKLIIINLHPLNLYRQYIKNYQESIDECHLDGLVSNDYDIESNQFITFYRLSTLLSFGGQKTFNLFKLDSTRNLLLTENDIKKSNINFHPLLFNSYDSSKLLIDNISIVEWLIDNSMMLGVLNSNMISIKFKSFDFGLSCFLNYEVLRNLKRSLIFEQFLKDFFLSSIENGSINILKKISNIVREYINVSQFYSTIELFLPNDIYISLEVFNYFNENGFDGFRDQLLYKFLKLSIDKHPSLKKVKINHNLNSLYDLILYFPKDLNLVKLLLNNIDKLKEDKPIHEQDNNIYNQYFDLVQNNFKTKQLVSIIKLIISKFNNNSNVYILNHYFNLLIRNYGVTIETIKTIQDLLFENSIVIENSTIRTFYYLNTRSPKFTKLILTGIKSYWLSLGTDQIKSIEIYISSFNYKYLTDYDQQEIYGNQIFKNSFDMILKELISNIIFKKFKTDPNIEIREFERLTKPLLIYFLKIGRRDLFLENYQWFKMMLYKHLNNLSILELIAECTSSILSPSVPSNGNLKLLNSISPIFRTNYFNDSFKFKKPNDDFDLNLFFKSCSQYELSIVLENYFNSNSFISKALFESFDFNNIDNLKFLIENYNNNIQLIGLFDYKKSCFPSLKFILNYFPQKFYNHIILPIDIQKESLNDLEFSDNFLNYINIYFSNNIDSLKFLNLENEKINQFIQELIIKIRELITTNKLLLIEKTDQSKQQKSDKHNEIKSIIEQKDIKKLLLSNLNNYLEIRDSQRNLKKSEFEIKYINDDNNLFIQSFINGDIKQCQLLLLHFKNFILTKSSITKTIINNNIFIIKYFYHKLIKNNFILLNYLKSQLLQNYDYKYNLNWLE
ncbi:hypothetical protein ACTFIR_009103 [Dictyostelium discoideum]